VVQCGRQLTDAVEGFLVGKRFLLHDRDPLFSDTFRETLAATGVETVRLPSSSPNLNAYAERNVRTIKEACLNRMIFVGERSLRRAITEFVTHYHRGRHYQGLGDVLIFPAGVRRRSDEPRRLPRASGRPPEVLPSTGRVGRGTRNVTPTITARTGHDLEQCQRD
jgi:putative transposase